MVIVKKAVENEEYQKKFSEILTSLGIQFQNISIYILAFIHRSIVNERPDFAPEHNERLEFLGDAVLELVVTDNLFRDFPEKPEWELTDIRSGLVRGKNLAKVAKELHFEEYLFLWRWEDLMGGRTNDYLLANCLEAFLWAIYLDLGIIGATHFINTYVYPSLKYILEHNLHKDFKSIIQEYAQAEYDITPSYDLLSSEGPDHDKVFEVGVFLWDKELARAKGGSKKKAQEEAARLAYEKKDSWNIIN